ncbi:prisilkin-39-like [Penaeus vannamei]|uniref:prisilkin-39-like n=1 Tax=Penaeus vannamei TaxID=6689 RepID=UPI00387FAEC7
MKTLIAVLLVAFVAAEQKREAEPSVGLHHPLLYPYGVGLGSAYGLYPYGGHILHKRDAEADPGYLLGGGLGLGGAYGYGLNYGLGGAYGYGYPLGHVSYSTVGHSIGKREAEPGYLLGGGLGLGGAYGYGLNYGLGGAYGYGYPLGHVSYSTVGHSIGKREAEPGYGHGLLGGLGGSYGYASSLLYPGIAHSYQYNHAVNPLIYG